MRKGKRLNGMEGRQADEGVKHPKKRLYRARAHSNPLNDSNWDTPAHPDDYDWSLHYPAFFGKGAAGQEPGATAEPASALEAAGTRHGGGSSSSAAADMASAAEPTTVRFADVGCGFGGLLIRLSPLFPDTLMLGLELRDKVSEYVKERVLAMRREQPGGYNNISCLRANAQKHLVHYFRKGQLTKLFFLFPDPHFKASTHRRRIISRAQLADYAYLLRPGGMLYTITDVEEVGTWMREKTDAHPLFQRLSDEELEGDVAAQLLASATEEGQKVARNVGQTFRSVYRRLASPPTRSSL